MPNASEILVHAVAQKVNEHPSTIRLEDVLNETIPCQLFPLDLTSTVLHEEARGLHLPSFINASTPKQLLLVRVFGADSHRTSKSKAIPSSTHLRLLILPPITSRPSFHNKTTHTHTYIHTIS